MLFSSLHNKWFNVEPSTLNAFSFLTLVYISVFNRHTAFCMCLSSSCSFLNVGNLTSSNLPPFIIFNNSRLISNFSCPSAINLSNILSLFLLNLLSSSHTILFFLQYWARIVG